MAQAILYHSPCMDGHTAAWAAWKKFGNQATYIPINYGVPIPDLSGYNELYFLDFALNAEEIINLAKSKQVTLLDHHKSSKEQWTDGVINTLESFSVNTNDQDIREIHLGNNSVIHFNMNKSGARLAWEFFHDLNIPDLVKYVEDRDLWRFNCPQSKAFHAYLLSIDPTFQNWSRVDEMLVSPKERPRILNMGGTILTYQEKVVERIVEQANSVRLRDINNRYYTVPAINTNYEFASDACNKLLDLNPDVPFVLAYSDQKDGFRRYSLRSKGFDTTLVSKSYGGGGHQKASGFESDIVEIIKA